MSLFLILCMYCIVQSYVSDENFSKMVGSPKRLFSYTGSLRKDSNSVDPLEKQASLQNQTSYLTQPSTEGSVGGKVLSQKEKQELWDKEVPPVSCLTPPPPPPLSLKALDELFNIHPMFTPFPLRFLFGDWLRRTARNGGLSLLELWQPSLLVLSFPLSHYSLVKF